MNILVLFPLVIVVLGIVLYFLKSKKKVLDILLIITTSISLIFSLILCFFDNNLKIELFRITTELIVLFKLDLISKIFIVLFSFIWLLVSIFSLKYMDKEENVNKFYSYTLLTLGCIVLLSLSGNLITMYLMFEMVTLASMPLVMHSKTKESKKAALKYLFYSLGGAFLGLISVVIGILYSSNGGEFILGGSLVALSSSNKIAIQIALLCGLIGFGAKCGAFPLQSWLPSAHPVAPSPASSLLSGVITKAGVIAIIRIIFYSFGTSIIAGSFVQYTWEVLLLITILLGSSLALFQKNIKRRLAYSSISQLSYILLGISSLTEEGFCGSILHVLSHAFIKVGLFLIAGFLIYQYDIHNVDEMEGMGKKAPISMWCFTLFSLALVGVPPFGSFFSKWYIALGSINSGLNFFNYFGAVVLLISAILTACYLLSISIKAFFPKNKEGLKREKEPLLMVIPLIILVSSVFLVGIFSSYLVDLLISVIGGGL